MRRPKVAKIDFSRTHKDLYSATSTIKEVAADRATFLSIEGVGEPGGTAFQESIGKLFAMAYTTKFTLLNAGKLDFAVARLECLWPVDPAKLPKSQWPWQLLIRIPDAVKERDLAAVRKEILRKKGLDTSAVKRWTWKEGRCLQVMHVGPYDAVGGTYQRLGKHAEERGLVAQGPGHEIYISDPSRVPPERLKTIIRMPVTRKG